MSLYLDTRGLESLAIGICGRCNVKYPIGALGPDPNAPGLFVCNTGCRDLYDPHRLPARQTENITLRFPRPDVPLGTDPSGIISEDEDYFLTDESGEGYLTP